MDILPLMPAGKWIAAGILLAFPAIRRTIPPAPPRGGPMLARVEPVLDLPCEIIEAKPAAPSRAPPAPPPAPKAAARAFVAWCIEAGFTGERLWTGLVVDRAGATTGIWHMYLWHCEQANVQPLPDNVFGEALATFATRTQKRDRSTGELRRLTAYVIPEALPAAKPSRVRRHGSAKPKLKNAA